MDRKLIPQLMMILTCINLILVGGTALIGMNHRLVGGEKKKTHSEALLTEGTETMSIEDDPMDAMDALENVFAQKIEEVSTDYLGSADHQQAVRVGNELKGVTLKTDHALQYRLGRDGTFSGFFDSAHKNVSGYRYEFAGYSHTILLNTYDPSQKKVVSYEVRPENRNGLELYYRPADLTIHVYKEK